MNPRTKEIYMYILGAVVVVGEIAMIIFMLYIWRFGASTVEQGVINLIYGLALGYHSAFMLVLGYFYGSSKSSADKNELLGKINGTGETQP
jgi:steroid 5-alpha reductase family enzyme